MIFLSRSDLRGGAAIVTYRLMMAMRELGIDARMLVCEKLSDSPYVEYCAPKWKIQYSFLKERLEVFLKNGCSRTTLFKIDPASEGLPVWKHPWVKEADAIFLGWVNQGMLSLNGVRRLAEAPHGEAPQSPEGGALSSIHGGKRTIVWVMHDMWNMTGVCHHAGDCNHFKKECGNCQLLGDNSHPNDLSHSTWQRKRALYDNCPIRFVAVSSWLAKKASESGLLGGRHVEVIPNAFPISFEGSDASIKSRGGNPVRIIFGAARIDDPIKGLPILKKALQELCDRYPKESENMELITFGGVKNPESLEGFAIPSRHLGVLSGEDAIRKAYEDSNIVVSSSDFETLPGTLIEGQAYGCIPVAFDHGGQRDIIDHQKTGYLAEWNDDPSVRAGSLAEGILWAYRNVNNKELIGRMRQSVVQNFDAQNVARRLLQYSGIAT